MIHNMIIPEWLPEGRTILIPKGGNINNPRNFRSATSLNTTYKIFTSVLSERITRHLVINDLLPVEQKGCGRVFRGCEGHVLFSKVIIEDCRKYKTSLAMGWIDYQKAFESVPHSRLIKSSEMIGLHPDAYWILESQNVSRPQERETHFS